MIRFTAARFAVGVSTSGIQIDQVQSSGTGFFPSLCELNGVITKDGLLIVISLTQTDRFAMTKINCGPNFQGVSPSRIFVSPQILTFVDSILNHIG